MVLITHSRFCPRYHIVTIDQALIMDNVFPLHTKILPDLSLHQRHEPIVVLLIDHTILKNTLVLMDPQPYQILL